MVAAAEVARQKYSKLQAGEQASEQGKEMEKQRRENWKIEMNKITM